MSDSGKAMEIDLDIPDPLYHSPSPSSSRNGLSNPKDDAPLFVVSSNTPNSRTIVVPKDIFPQEMSRTLIAPKPNFVLSFYFPQSFDFAQLSQSYSDFHELAACIWFNALKEHFGSPLPDNLPPIPSYNLICHPFTRLDFLIHQPLRISGEITINDKLKVKMAYYNQERPQIFFTPFTCPSFDPSDVKTALDIIVEKVITRNMVKDRWTGLRYTKRGLQTGECERGFWWTLVSPADATWMTKTSIMVDGSDDNSHSFIIFAKSAHKKTNNNNNNNNNPTQNRTWAQVASNPSPPAAVPATSTRSNTHPTTPTNQAHAIATKPTTIHSTANNHSAKAVGANKKKGKGKQPLNPFRPVTYNSIDGSPPPNIQLDQLVRKRSPPPIEEEPPNKKHKSTNAPTTTTQQSN